ncbi:MAG: phosphoenolpyruvate carboxylase [Natronomonas sp.]
MSLHDRDVERDVRELSTLLGDVLAEQASRADLETVERLRAEAIQYRRGDLDSRSGIYERLHGLESETREVVARAFTAYFELINLAEERERVRAVREASEDGILADSVEAAIERLRSEGADSETVQQVLDDTLIQPTFTAHPTEARRKSIKAKLRTVAGYIETLDERRLTERERDRIDRGLRAEVTSLWQTPQIRQRPPKVTDEARNVQWYLENVLFDVVGAVYDELERVLGEQYDDIDVPKLFEFRSWAGSDRDGNPYVTPAVTAETLDRQRRVILKKYRDELEALSGALSQNTEELPVGKRFERSLSVDRADLPKVAEAAETENPDELYRQKLRLMRERLDRVGDVRPEGYDSADELRTDLKIIADSLRKGGAEVVAETYVAPLVRQVDTFGFTLASLDLRDHRENHTETVGTVFERVGVDYAEMDEAERVETLTDAIDQDSQIVDTEAYDSFEGTTARVLERFDALSEWQREYGADAIDTYCISMTEEPSHVLEVLFLADQAGVVDLPDYCGLDIVPLLETESALSGARRIMGTLFENEVYASVIEARGGVQEVILGYSDSNKENGFLAANRSLYKNQIRLARITDDYDIDLRLFHGRGGSISRGGGPMNQALLALPDETVTGQVKFTEQGEAIAEKYANPQIAGRNLEQMLNAQIRARYQALAGDGESVPEAWTDTMDVAADAARGEYRDFLETDGFVAYFEQATPIRVIEDLNLGSRPASRSGERTVEDLRAIPWVFSWTQARCIVPGWYGLGTGLQTCLESGDAETLREMYRNWPTFRLTIDNAALALARTDLEIAAEYAALADNQETFFPRIEAEYERCVEGIREITGRDRLPARSWIIENLHRRNPYVDPLNLLQVQLLDKEQLTDLEQRTLRLTVKGIAAGMKSTG